MASSVATETCKNCGRTIGALEEAYLFRDRPVCKDCYARLTGKQKDPLLYAAVGGAGMAVLAAVIFVVVLKSSRKVPSAIEPAASNRLLVDATTPPQSWPSPPTPVVPTVTQRPIVTPIAVAAPPPAPTTATVSGSAYVVRQNGQSDILRGFHVTLVQPTVPANVFQATLATVFKNFKDKAVESRSKAAQERKDYAQIASSTYDPGKYYDDDAARADQNAAKYGRLLASVSGAVDSPSALHALEATGYVHVISDLVDAIAISGTTTDVQGAYKFKDAPIGACIFAMFDTKDGFLMWAIPVTGAGSIDLFNDTALVSK